MSESGFSGREALSDALLAEITQLRVSRPEAVRQYAAQRQRRAELAPQGKLVILAADHPARLVTSATGNPLALANRQEYLGRIWRVLQSGAVDGLMGTPDILEEALAADFLTGARLLDHKLLVGCMNRGGLAGTAFELWDSFTAYDARGLREMNLDGAKLMFRLDPGHRDSGQTVLWCAAAINDCLDHDLTVFLEPLPVREHEGKFVVQKDAASLARICGVATALGRSSLRTWLKLPVGPDYELVAASTTCPVLMLGGEAIGQPQALLEELAAGMAAGPNVRGALIGRNVLYPGAADPAVMARAVWRVVHDGLPAAAAWDEATGAG